MVTHEHEGYLWKWTNYFGGWQQRYLDRRLFYDICNILIRLSNRLDWDWIFGRDWVREDPILARAGNWPFWDFSRGRDYEKKDKLMMIFESDQNCITNSYSKVENPGQNYELAGSRTKTPTPVPDPTGKSMWSPVGLVLIIIQFRNPFVFCEEFVGESLTSLNL